MKPRKGEVILHHAWIMPDNLPSCNRLYSERRNLGDSVADEAVCMKEGTLWDAESCGLA